MRIEPFPSWEKTVRMAFALEAPPPPGTSFHWALLGGSRHSPPLTTKYNGILQCCCPHSLHADLRCWFHSAHPKSKATLALSSHYPGTLHFFLHIKLKWHRVLERRREKERKRDGEGKEKAGRERKGPPGALMGAYTESCQHLSLP